MGADHSTPYTSLGADGGRASASSDSGGGVVVPSLGRQSGSHGTPTFDSAAAMQEAAIASCLRDITSQLSGETATPNRFSDDGVASLDGSVAALEACISSVDESAPLLEHNLTRLKELAKPLVQLMTGEEASAREEAVARTVEGIARMHPEIQRALLSAGAAQAITSRLEASNNEAGGLGKEALKAALLRAICALASTRTTTPSHMRAYLAMHLVDTGAVREVVACLKCRMSCDPTEHAAIEFRVAAARTLMTILGLEGVAAVETKNVAEFIQLMTADTAQADSPVPLEVANSLCQLLEALWEQEKREKKLLPSASELLTHAENEMKQVDINAGFDTGIITQIELGNEDGTNDVALGTSTALNISKLAGLSAILGHGKEKTDCLSSSELPLQVRAALVSGGVMQALWRLFGRDRGDHIASIFLSYVPKIETHQVPATEERLHSIKYSGNDAHQMGSKQTDGEDNLNLLLDKLCSMVNESETALLDPKRSHDSRLFRFPSFSTSATQAMPLKGLGVQIVACLRGTLRLLDWAAEAANWGEHNEIVIHGVAAAAALISRVFRRDAPRSIVIKSLNVSLMPRVKQLIKTVLVASSVQPEGSAAETLKSTACAIACLCTSSNEVCHTVLQMCWGSNADSENTGEAKREVCFKLAAAAAGELSTPEAVRSEPNAIPVESAASLLRVALCAGESENGARWAALVCVRTIRGFLACIRDADVLCSMHAHTKLLDVVKIAVVHRAGSKILSEATQALAVGLNTGGAFFRSVIADADKLNNVLVSLAKVCAEGDSRFGTDEGSICVASSIYRLVSIPAVANAIHDPSLTVALVQRLISVKRQRDTATSSRENDNRSEAHSPWDAQEMNYICTSIACVLGAKLQVDDSEDAFDNDCQLSPVASSLVASGAVSCLVDILAGNGWEHWDTPTIEATGAILQYIVQRTEYAPGEVLAAGCIAKVEIHLTALSTGRTAHATASLRVMKALSSILDKPFAFCFQENYHNTDAARMGNAALGLIGVLHEKSRNPTADSTSFNSLVDGVHSFEHLSSVLRLVLTAAWLSSFDAVSFDHTSGTSVLSSFSTDTLFSVLEHDMDNALRATVISSTAPSLRETLAPEAFMAVSAAISSLPINCHVMLVRRFGVNTVESIIGTKAVAAAASQIIHTASKDEIGAMNDLASLARAAAGSEPSSVNCAVIGFISLLKATENTVHPVSEVDIVSALTLLVKETGLRSVAITAIENGAMTSLSRMMRRPMGSRDNASAVTAVQAMDAILQLASYVSDEKLSLPLAPEIVLSLPTADDLVSIIDGTARGYFNDVSNAAIGIVMKIGGADQAGANRLVLLEAGVDRAIIELAQREKSSRQAAAGALVALCPGLVRGTHSALQSPHRMVNEAMDMGVCSTHASVLVSLLQAMGWLPEEAHMAEKTGRSMNADNQSVSETALQGLLGVLINDGPEYVDATSDETDVMTRISDGIINNDIPESTMNTKNQGLSAAECRVNAWAKQARVLLGEECCFSPLIKAALLVISPRALCAILTPTTLTFAASRMGIDAISAILLLGSRCANADDVIGVAKVVNALSPICASLNSNVLGNIRRDDSVICIAALFEIEAVCSALGTNTLVEGGNVAKVWRAALQNIIAFGKVPRKLLTECAIRNLLRHAQLALEASRAGKEINPHISAGSAAIQILCTAISSAKDVNERMQTVAFATTGYAASAAGMFMDVDAGSGVAFLTSLAAVGVGVEGEIDSSPAAAAASAATRAAKRSTCVQSEEVISEVYPCGVMTATVTTLQLLDMRSKDGVGAPEALKLVKEVMAAALELLGTGAVAEGEATGSLAAVFAALFTCGVDLSTSLPDTAYEALVRNGHASTLKDAVGERCAVSISIAITKAAMHCVEGTSNVSSETLKDDTFWWMPGAARALVELMKYGHDMLALTAATETIPYLISAMSSVATADHDIANERLRLILEALVAFFTASPNIVVNAAGLGAGDVLGKMIRYRRGTLPPEALWLMSELLGNDEDPLYISFPASLADKIAVLNVMDGLSDKNTAVQLAAANIIRHSASNDGGPLAAAALIDAGAPDFVSRRILNSQFSAQADETADVVLQLSVALLNMMRKQNKIDTETDMNAPLSPEGENDSLLMNIIESHDYELAKGIAICATFAAYEGLSSIVPASGSTPNQKSESTFHSVVLCLKQRSKTGDFPAASAAASLLIHLTLDARARLFSAGAGPALIHALGVPQLASACAEEIRRILSIGSIHPEWIAYIRWLVDNVLSAVKATVADVAAEQTGNKLNEISEAQTAVIGSAATSGPLGVAMDVMRLLIPFIDGIKSTVADEAIAALAVEGVASLAHTSFALRATAIRLDCTAFILRRAVLNAQLRIAGKPELSSDARHLLESSAIAPHQCSGSQTDLTVSQPFLPGKGYCLHTVEFLCDLLKISGGSNYCEYPAINEAQAKILLDCMLVEDDISNDGELQRRLQLATLMTVSSLSRASHNHAALMEGAIPSVFVDLSTDDTVHLDVRLASLRALDGMLGGDGLLAWSESNESAILGIHTTQSIDSVHMSSSVVNSQNNMTPEEAVFEEDNIRRVCMMRLLAASAGQLSAYDPNFTSGLWLAPSEQLELGKELAIMANPDAETAALLRALYLRVVRDAMSERAGKSMTVAETLQSPSSWPHELAPLTSRHGLCQIASPALRSLSPGTLCALIGLGGLKPLVRALGPAIAPLLGSLLEAAGGSLWARLGQPLGTTEGPRLAEVASELAKLYKLHPDPSGVVGIAAQTGASSISGVLTSSPDKAGKEQATRASRVLADAAASAPNCLGIAVARAFLVSDVLSHLFTIACPGKLLDVLTGSRSHFATEEAILTICSIASLIPDEVGDAAVDSKSIPSLLSIVKGNQFNYDMSTRSAACKIIAAAAYCEENISVLMHAGAADTIVNVLTEAGSVGNDLVGDSAESVCKSLISITGAQADAPEILLRAQLEGGILLERLRRSPPHCRVMMSAVLKRLIFEAYNTRVSLYSTTGEGYVVSDGAKQTPLHAGQIIPPLPLSVIPPVKPDILRMLTSSGDIEKDATARSVGALGALSVDTHMELMEAGARAPLVAACGGDVLEALTHYICQHADGFRVSNEEWGSAVNEMLTLCAAAGTKEEAARRAKLTALTARALVAAFRRGKRVDGDDWRLRIIAGNALCVAAAVPQVLVAAVRAGALVAALRAIESIPLPITKLSPGSLEGALNSVIMLWVLLSDEHTTVAGDVLETYSANSRSQIRPAVEEVIFDTSSACPSLTGSAMLSLISLLEHFSTSFPQKALSADGIQAIEIRATIAALGLVRFWCADDFNRQAFALAGAGIAAAKLTLHPDVATQHSASRTVTSLVAFPALKGLSRQLAVAVGPLASSTLKPNSSDGLVALLDLAIMSIALDAEECRLEASLPLRDATMDTMDVSSKRKAIEALLVIALDAVAAFLLDAKQVNPWHAAAAETLAALPTSSQAKIISRGALKPLIACIGGQASRGIVKYLERIASECDRNFILAPGEEKCIRGNFVAETIDCLHLIANMLDTSLQVSDADSIIVHFICTLLECKLESDNILDDKNEIMDRYTAGVECSIIALRGRRELVLVLLGSTRLVSALLNLFHPDVDIGIRYRAAEALSMVASFVGVYFAAPPPTTLDALVVSDFAMQELREMLRDNQKTHIRLAAAMIIGYLGSAPLTALKLMKMGCGALLLTAATDIDNKLVHAAFDAICCFAGVDPSTESGTLANAIDTGFRAAIAARDDFTPKEDHEVLKVPEKGHIAELLLQVVVDSIVERHPDFAAYASAARTPERLHSIAKTLTACAITPNNPITDVLAALGTDTVIALASDPLLLGPICQLIGPVAAPALAAQFESLDESDEPSRVVDLANALASLVPMTTAKDASYFGTMSNVDDDTDIQGHDESRELIAAAFIRAIPKISAILSQGTDVCRAFAIIALHRLAFVSGQVFLSIMAANDVVAALAKELERSGPSPARANNVDLKPSDDLVRAIELKKSSTLRGEHDIRVCEDSAVVLPAARDDAVKLFAALIRAAGDDVSSVTLFPLALARALIFAAVDSIDDASTIAALDVLSLMTSGNSDINRVTLIEAGAVPALVLFLRTGESKAARDTAGKTLHNLSIVRDKALGNGRMYDHDALEVDNTNTQELVLTRLQDAICAIIGAHGATMANTSTAEYWALNAMHPLLCRLIYEVHIKFRNGDTSFFDSTNEEIESGIMHLIAVLAKADVKSGYITVGTTASNQNEVINISEDFDIIGDWLDDKEDKIKGDVMKGGMDLHSVTASEAARAGLVALPLDVQVSLMRSSASWEGLFSLTAVIGARAAPGLAGVIKSETGTRAAVASALLGLLASKQDTRSSVPVAVAERSVVPVIATRLRSDDPRLVVSSATSCLALAELAPCLRSALLGSGVVPLLMAGITISSASLSAICTRALWALLQDDEVWKAFVCGLRGEISLGDTLATELIQILNRCVIERGMGPEGNAETTKVFGVIENVDATNDGRITVTYNSMCAEILGNSIWSRFRNRFEIFQDAEVIQKAVLGLIRRTAQVPENRVILLRAGAPSAVAASFSVAATENCLETLLLCSTPGYIDGCAPQQPPAVTAATRQLERLARWMMSDWNLAIDPHEFPVARGRQWASAVLGHLSEETARMALNLPDDVPAHVPPLFAASFNVETRSRLVAIGEMLQLSLPGSEKQVVRRGRIGQSPFTADEDVSKFMKMAAIVASACAGALQVMQSTTHAELLRHGAAAGLAAHLGINSEHKAHMLLKALTIAVESGFARGAATVSHELWVLGSADSAAAKVGMNAIPVLARLLMIPRITSQHEAALGFYWIEKLRSQESKWRANHRSSAGHDTLEQSISSAERDSIVSLLKIIVDADNPTFADDGGNDDMISVIGDEGITSVAEASALALCTMAAVPTLATAIFDAELGSSALKSGLARKNTRHAILSLLLVSAKHDECKARIVVADLVEHLLTVVAEIHEMDSSVLARIISGSKAEEWWVSSNVKNDVNEASAAVIAARAVISLFEWGDSVDKKSGGGWLIDTPKSGLQEPAGVVIKRTHAAATACLALAIKSAKDWREGWCHVVHSNAVRALAATACAAAYVSGGSSLPSTAPMSDSLAAAVCSLPLSNLSFKDRDGEAALRRALYAWHPDIQAAAAIHRDDTRGIQAQGRVEALASVGGIAVVTGLLAVAKRADCHCPPILGFHPKPNAPSTADVCTALTTSTCLIKEISYGRISTETDMVCGVPAPTAWDVGTAVAAAVSHLLGNHLESLLGEKEILLEWPEDSAVHRGSSDAISMLISAAQDAFASAGQGASAAAAANPKLLLYLRKILVVAPIPIRAVAAFTIAPIITFALSSASNPSDDFKEDFRRCPIPKPSPIALKEAMSVMTLMSLGDAKMAQAGAELALAYTAMPGAGDVLLEALVVDRLIAVLSESGMDYNGARLAAARTIWRLLFGPVTDIPDFATDGKTTIDLHAAVAKEAKPAEASLIASDSSHIKSSGEASTGMAIERMNAPGGSERWRAIRIMRNKKRSDAIKSNRSEDDFQTGKVSSLTFPTLCPSAPPMLKVALHQVVRLLVLLVRGVWAKGLCGTNNPKHEHIPLGHDDRSAAAAVLEHLVYDSLSLGVLNYANNAPHMSKMPATPIKPREETESNGKFWGDGFTRALRWITSSDNDDPAGLKISEQKVVDNISTSQSSSQPTKIFTSNDGVQRLVELLRGNTDPILLEALKPAFQALSLDTKLAVAQDGAHEELIRLIGIGGCGDLMINLLINQGANATGALMDGEGVPELAEAIAATTWDDPMGSGAAAASAVPALVRLLRRGNQEGRGRAASALWSLAIGSPAVVIECHRIGAVSALLEAFQSSGGEESGDEVIGALWALASTPEHADEIVAAGGVPIAIAHLVHGSSRGREAAASLLRACASAPDGSAILIDAGAVETLTEVLRGADHDVSAAAAAAVSSLAPPKTKEAVTLTRLTKCIMQSSASASQRPSDIRLSRQLCSLVEQLVFDFYISTARSKHVSRVSCDALIAKEAVDRASRVHAIATLIHSVGALKLTALHDAISDAVSLLNRTTLTKLVSAGAAVPLQRLISAESMAQPLLESVSFAVTQIRGKAAADELLGSSRALAYVFKDLNQSKPNVAAEIRQSAAVHFPKLANIISGFDFSSYSVLAAVGSLHALVAADGVLMLAAAEAGTLGSLALAMRRFGPDPAGVAAAATLWTMCAIGPEARNTLVDNGVIALAVGLLRFQQTIIIDDVIDRIVARKTRLNFAALDDDTMGPSGRTLHEHLQITSATDATADGNNPMPALFAGVGLLACLISDPGAAEQAVAAGAVPLLVDLLEFNLKLLNAVNTFSERTLISEAAEATTMVFRGMFGEHRFMNQLVQAGAVGVLTRTIKLCDEDNRVMGDHAVAALITAMDNAIATDSVSPAVSFAVDQARALASQLLDDDPDGPFSPAVLEALVVDVLFAQLMQVRDDDSMNAFTSAPPEAFSCRAAVHALLIDTVDGSDARRTAASGAVSALSIQSKAAIIRVGRGALDPLVVACGPWAAEALVHYLVTAPDALHVGAVALALRSIAEGLEHGSGPGHAILPALAGWGSAAASTLLFHLQAACSDSLSSVRDVKWSAAAECAAALVAISCVSQGARVAVASSGLLDQVLFHLGVGCITRFLLR